MSLMVIKCGGENCKRLHYVQVEPGEATIYCYLCENVMVITFKPDDTDSED